MQRKIRPKIAALVPSYIASCQIGVIKPLCTLADRKEIELTVKLETRASASDVHRADVVVFCRNTEPASHQLLNEALSIQKPTVFDLDDNFWDVPFESDPELARYHRLPPRIQQLERYLANVSLVRVYNPVLLERVRRFNKNVRLLKAGFDFNLVKGTPERTHSQGKLKIVYATSRTLDTQYQIFREALMRLLKTYPEHAEMTIWGCQPGEFAALAGIKLLPLVNDYDRFLHNFARSDFDIGLAPLEDTQFHRSKTNTKFRDYGACRIAGIYSNVEVYSSCVNNMVTGVLVNNTSDAWYAALEKLLNDDQLRHSIQKAAFDEVQRNHNQKTVEKEWLQQIAELLDENNMYALSNNSKRSVAEILIRADREGLFGIRFPAHSPGEREPVGKVFLEIATTDGNILRQFSSTQQTQNGTDEICFTFPTIENSRFQEFILRFISAAEESATAQRWTPPAGYIQMLYKQHI